MRKYHTQFRSGIIGRLADTGLRFRIAAARVAAPSRRWFPVHGHGQEHVKILLRSSAIQKRVREIGLQISKDYKGQRVHLIGVLKGAAIFLSDLIRQIRVEVPLEFMSVSSYGKGNQSSGQVRL